MRWLYQLFFLERFTWSRFLRWKQKSLDLSRIAEQEEKILYRAELDYLSKRLSEQLKEHVYYSFDHKGYAICGTAEGIVARISVHTKGARRSLVYLVIEIADGYECHKAWFQLAFLGFKLRFKRPTLSLKNTWSITPTPRRR